LTVLEITYSTQREHTSAELRTGDATYSRKISSSRKAVALRGRLYARPVRL